MIFFRKMVTGYHVFFGMSWSTSVRRTAERCAFAGVLCVRKTPCLKASWTCMGLQVFIKVWGGLTKACGLDHQNGQVADMYSAQGLSHSLHGEWVIKAW